MSVSLVTRADDFGSSRSANLAILRAARGGFIRNVSCMAPGPLMDDGAQQLRRHRHLCLGLHLTLNAEWDLIRWPPVSAPESVPSLVAQDGALFSDPSLFHRLPPRMEDILREMDAQLDLLCRLKLDIRYVDSHMLPERFVPGLQEAVSAWAARKGLIDHMRYYRFPSRMEPHPYESLEEGRRSFTAWLDLLKEGQYLLVMHPALGGRDMLLCRRPGAPAPQVQRRRQAEYALLRSAYPETLCEARGIHRLRYDQAQPLP